MYGRETYLSFMQLVPNNEWFKNLPTGRDVGFNQTNKQSENAWFLVSEFYELPNYILCVLAESNTFNY